MMLKEALLIPVLELFHAPIRCVVQALFSPTPPSPGWQLLPIRYSIACGPRGSAQVMEDAGKALHMGFRAAFHPVNAQVQNEGFSCWFQAYFVFWVRPNLCCLWGCCCPLPASSSLCQPRGQSF